MLKTITIEELNNMYSDSKEVEMSKIESPNFKMAAPSSKVDDKKISKIDKYTKPIHVSKIAGLLLSAIILQAVFNTSFVQAYIMKYIPNKFLAKITPFVIFTLIVGGLFYTTIK